MGPEPNSISPSGEERENHHNRHHHHQHHHNNNNNDEHCINHNGYLSMEEHQNPDGDDQKGSSEDSILDDPEYLFQLIRDRRALQAFPNLFLHLDRLLDDEIARVHNSVLYLGTNTEPLILPEPQGPVITLSEKLSVPFKEHPDFNFVGRLLGPRGMTAKQLEIDTGCRILVRGRGSLRDKRKEEQMKGKTKWEHLNEDLHVLIHVEDTRNRAQVKLNRAMEEVKKLLVPSLEGEDELKKRQLLELALINGTYKGLNPLPMTLPPLILPHPAAALNGHFSPPVAGFGPGMPGPGGMVAMPLLLGPGDPSGAPIILPHPVPILSPTSMTPLQSPIGAPPGVRPPGAVLSTPVETPGVLFHFEPCLLSPTSPSTPLLENPLLKQPPFLLQHPPQLAQHQPQLVQQSQQLAQQSHQLAQQSQQLAQQSSYPSNQQIADSRRSSAEMGIIHHQNGSISGDVMSRNNGVLHNSFFVTPR